MKYSNTIEQAPSGLQLVYVQIHWKEELMQVAHHWGRLRPVITMTDWT